MSDDFAPPADIACTVPDEYGAHCLHWAYRTASCCMCGAGIWEEDSDEPECPALRAVQVTTPAEPPADSRGIICGIVAKGYDSGRRCDRPECVRCNGMRRAASPSEEGERQ